MKDAVGGRIGLNKPAGAARAWVDARTAVIA
jgi:hypothetical protein